MGVLCQIHLTRPVEGVYKPGDLVIGEVKYIIQEDTFYKDIVVSLWGRGKCTWEEGVYIYKVTYIGFEEFVKTTKSLLDNKTENEVLVKAGTYSHPFRFQLPFNIQPSYKDSASKISYFVKLTFERKGFFKFNKTFRTELPVGSFFNTNLPQPMIDYISQKKLTSLFDSDDGGVKMKVTIKKSALIVGETVTLDVEIKNDSSTKITTVETQLLEEVTYIDGMGNKDFNFRTVERAKFETEPVKGKRLANLTAAIKIPEGHYTIKDTKVLLREYKISVKAKLPFPQSDLVMAVPIQIFKFSYQNREPQSQQAAEATSEDQPPSYWETMNEDRGKKKG